MTILDKFYHFGLCFVVTAIFGWKIGVTVGLTIEGTQVEAYYRRGKALKNYWWSDTFIDLIADGLGIFAGMYLRKLIGV